jgi:putative nucleotidyltransferase with HDIG domain
VRALLTSRLLVAATAGCGCALVMLAAIEAGPLPLGTFALLAAAAFVTELFVVPRDETSFDPRDRTSFTFSASVHIAAVITLGIWPGVLVAAFGVVAADGLGRYPWRKVAFNAAASALATSAGGLVFLALGGEPGTLSLPGDFPAVAAMALVLYGVGALLVSAVIALESGSPLGGMAREGLLTGLAASIGEAGVGVAFGFFLLTEPWAAVALLPLLLAVFRSHERLVTLRRETAHALETFANVVDERDPYTYRHSARVAEYVRSLAESLDLPERKVAQLRWAGRLHDLGKISVDAGVLRKPGKLDAREWEAMRMHPRLSARLLRRFRLASRQAKAVEYHHERFDGTGYYGIDPAELPLEAHFLVIADSFDAMTSDRPYRLGLPTAAALEEIERHAGAQFHPVLAKAFVALQQGRDPLAVLTEEELKEVRRVLRDRAAWDVVHGLQLHPHHLIAGGVLASLLAIGLGELVLALPGVLLATTGVGLDRIEAIRSRRLSQRLRVVLSQAGNPEGVFTRLVTALSVACDLRWIGLLSWDERECSGSLALEWSGGAAAPSDAALVGWLMREAESTGTIAASGAELGRTDPHLAVPLRNGELSAYLVMAIGDRAPRALPKAFGNCATLIAQSLLVAETGEEPRLKAVAG